MPTVSSVLKNIRIPFQLKLWMTCFQPTVLDKTDTRLSSTKYSRYSTVLTKYFNLYSEYVVFQIIKMFSQNEIWTPIVPSLVGEQEGQNKINLYMVFPRIVLLNR